MATDRDTDREWLEKGASTHPDGWEAGIISDFGIEGALDLVALQSGRVFDVDFRHRPFAGNDPLKEIVRNAQEAVSRAQRVSYEIWWQAGEERRAERDLTA